MGLVILLEFTGKEYNTSKITKMKFSPKRLFLTSKLADHPLGP